MRNVVVTKVERAEQSVIDDLRTAGVSTVHEAMGRFGLMHPRIRPIYAGAQVAGSAITVLVQPGEQVVLGQPVMTLEAMKMEHVHTAGVAGRVSSIDVAEGEQVTTGRIVVEIAAA